MPRLHKTPFPTDLTPFRLFQRIRRRLPNAFLLESRPGPERLARFSIVGARPRELFRDTNGEDPFPLIQEVLDQHGIDQKLQGYNCGLVGAIGYDAIAHTDMPDHPIRGPTYQLGLFLDGIVYDHQRGYVDYIHLDEERLEMFEEAARAETSALEPLEVTKVTRNTTRERWEEMVAETKRRIHEGETYQTVISRRFDATYKGDLGQLYRQLQLKNPSPYMYFLDFEPTQLLGSSPEMLVRVENDVAETFPIAGTRPVLEDPVEDAAIRQELMSDEKETAEHIMLVDLARNDLGRVCETGTIDVPSYRRLESFANVHHLVSHVTGRLAEGTSPLDAFKSVFPAGTVSGAPKIRATQIIDELESEPRGFYAGSVGYFSLANDLDSAITIRTLTADREGNLSVQAGAGIVQDSTAQAEWEETKHKANAILNFLEAPAQ